MKNVKALLNADGSFTLQGVVTQAASEEAVDATTNLKAPTGKEIKKNRMAMNLDSHPAKESLTPAQIGSCVASVVRSLPRTCCDKWTSGAQEQQISDQLFGLRPTFWAD